MSALHATQWRRATLHTWRIGLHSRSEVHGGGRATQRPSEHICASWQSRSALQSTQMPSAAEHTCPGHIVELTQRVTDAQAWRIHTRGAAQSAAALHWTHRPAATSHTRPLDEHSRSDAQVDATGRSGEAAGTSGEATASSGLDG